MDQLDQAERDWITRNGGDPDAAAAIIETNLLNQYAEQAGLLIGALENIADMASAGVSRQEIGMYARDVLARAGCEPAQAGR